MYMYAYVHACTCVVSGGWREGPNLDHPVESLVLIKLCPGEVTHCRPGPAGGTTCRLKAGAGVWD